MGTIVFPLFSTEGLEPGATQDFFASGFGGRDVVAITAIAARGPEELGEHRYFLAVENVRVQTHAGSEVPDEDAYFVHCTVRNVGSDPVPSYQVNVAVISP